VVPKRAAHPSERRTKPYPRDKILRLINYDAYNLLKLTGIFFGRGIYNFLTGSRIVSGITAPSTSSFSRFHPPRLTAILARFLLYLLYGLVIEWFNVYSGGYASRWKVRRSLGCAARLGTTLVEIASSLPTYSLITVTFSLFLCPPLAGMHRAIEMADYVFM